MSQNLPDSAASQEDDFLDFDSLTQDSPALPVVKSSPQALKTLVIVETAFLASTTALIWLINFYFPPGPLLRIFFPIPIALAYLRWGRRAAWMTATVSALLLSVLMGPSRSVQFLIPHGLLGLIFGSFWRRGSSWRISIVWGTVVNGLGLLFQVGLLSLLSGENLWIYATQQVTSLLDWIFALLGLLVQPDLRVVQGIAILIVMFNSLIYALMVHLAAWLLLDRLGNSIPDPPEWLQVLLNDRDF
jgi:uncharacterized protein YybS (DUF2232 family)